MPNIFLFDLQHPAHFYFFRETIKRLESEGHQVLLTGREKDILRDVVQSHGYAITIFGKARPGLLNMGLEFIWRCIRLFKIVRNYRPVSMAAIAGTYISPVGKLLGIPVHVFTDTEHATLSNKVAFPCATRIYVPECYREEVSYPHLRYKGYHELAYLGARYFQPDMSVLESFGIRDDEPFVLLRFVGWGAVHDKGLKGMTDRTKRKSVELFSKYARVVISSEAPLPPDLEPYRLSIPVEKIHHVMAHASLVFGESATMASEAAMLGVPSVFIDEVGRGYTDELEQKYGLVNNFKPSEQDAAVKRGVEILAENDRQKWRALSKAMHSEMVDINQVIYNALLEQKYSDE